MPVKKPSAAFGSRLARFNNVGLHPNLNANNPINESKTTGPGSYFKNVEEAFRWKNKHKVERQKEKLIYKFDIRDLIAQKVCERTWGGPGTYDYKKDTFKITNMPKDKSFGTTERLPPVAVGVAPNAYFKNTAKLSTLLVKKTTPKPTFEWGIKNRLSTKICPWWKSPAQYAPKDLTGFEAIMKKTVSKKGPYNLFTGPRDETTIKNHFGARKGEGADKFYEITGHVDFLMTHPSKRTYGMFREKIVRVPCTRNHKHTGRCFLPIDYPGPASYDISKHSIKKAKQTKCAFNSSVIYARPGPKSTVHPGPGRYFHKKRCVRKTKKKSSSMIIPIEKNIIQELYSHVSRSPSKKIRDSTMSVSARLSGKS